MNENRPKIRFAEVYEEISKVGQQPKSQEATGWENIRRRAVAKAIIRKRKGQFARKERSYDFSKMSRNCVAAVIKMLSVECMVPQFRLKKVTVDTRTLSHRQMKVLLPRARQIILKEKSPSLSRVQSLVRQISPESAFRRPTEEKVLLYIRDPVAHLDAKAISELRKFAKARGVRVYRHIDREYVLLGHEKPVHIIEYALDSEDEISGGEEEEVGYQEEDDIPYSNPPHESLLFRQ